MIDRVVSREREELSRQELAYRGDRPVYGDRGQDRAPSG